MKMEQNGQLYLTRNEEKLFDPRQIDQMEIINICEQVIFQYKHECTWKKIFHLLKWSVENNITNPDNYLKNYPFDDFLNSDDWSFLWKEIIDNYVRKRRNYLDDTYFFNYSIHSYPVSWLLRSHVVLGRYFKYYSGIFKYNVGKSEKRVIEDILRSELNLLRNYFNPKYYSASPINLYEIRKIFYEADEVRKRYCS